MKWLQFDMVFVYKRLFLLPQCIRDYTMSITGNFIESSLFYDLSKVS